MGFDDSVSFGVKLLFRTRFFFVTAGQSQLRFENRASRGEPSGESCTAGKHFRHEMRCFAGDGAVMESRKTAGTIGVCLSLSPALSLFSTMINRDVRT